MGHVCDKQIIISVQLVEIIVLVTFSTSVSLHHCRMARSLLADWHSSEASTCMCSGLALRPAHQKRERESKAANSTMTHLTQYTLKVGKTCFTALRLCRLSHTAIATITMATRLSSPFLSLVTKSCRFIGLRARMCITLSLRL